MEIALNKESKRKSAVAVFFRNGERLVGADAATSGNKYPYNTYVFLFDHTIEKFNLDINIFHYYWEKVLMIQLL